MIITIVAAEGIGNIIMATPLVTACQMMGHKVNFYVSPTPKNIRIAPLFYKPGITVSQNNWDKFFRQSDRILVTFWGRNLFPEQEINSKFAINRTFNIFGSEIEQNMTLAHHQIDYRGPTPATWVIPSNRKFDIGENAVIIHPGCKENWRDRNR